MIYYVKPLHEQVAYRDFPRTPSGLAVSEELPKRILCLPMHPYLSEADQDRIIATIRNFIGSQLGAGSRRNSAESSYDSAGRQPAQTFRRCAMKCGLAKSASSACLRLP